jgi:hypothetical protein
VHRSQIDQGENVEASRSSRSGMLRRLALLASAMLPTMTVPFLTPAWACGCGAYDPVHGGHASVPVETALVRDDPGAEDVYLSLTVDSTSRAGALLFPVPDRHASVKAGPAGLFDDLAALTAPQHTTGHEAGG